MGLFLLAIFCLSLSCHGVEGGKGISRPENMTAKVQVLDSGEAVGVSLAKYIANLSEKFVREKGAFTIVLSGVLPLITKLVEEPYVSSVEWSKWHVFWLDERFVPQSDPDNNYKLANDSFLSKVPIPSSQVYAINVSLPSVAAAAYDYESRLKYMVHHKQLRRSSAKNRFPNFDLNLVGMGPDGHIAALFPNTSQLYEKKRWVTFYKDAPAPPPQRISLTLPVINSSEYIAIVAVGEIEADAVGIALGGSGGGSDLLPVQMVSAQKELVWFLDKAAASKLE